MEKFGCLDPQIVGIRLSWLESLSYLASTNILVKTNKWRSNTDANTLWLSGQCCGQELVMQMKGKNVGV